MKSVHSIFFASVLTTYANPSLAIEESDLKDIYGGDEFISIATGSAQPISKAPSVASVITAKDIARIGATELDEVLKTVPGLHVSINAGYTPIYSFRGIHADLNPQVLILINGTPITNLFHGDRNLAWGGMPIESISRIEIIRGPGSAIYGADAFAGTINIITLTPAEADGLRGGTRYGTLNSKDVWLIGGRDLGPVQVAASLEWGETDGNDDLISSDAQTQLDLLASTQASLAPGSVQTSNERLDARLELKYNKFVFRTGAQIRNDIGLGAGVAQALDPSGRVASDRYNADLTFHDPFLSKNLGLKLNASFLQTSQEVEENIILYPPGSTGPFFNNLGNPVFPPFPNGVIGNPEVYERHYRGNITGTYRGFKRHEITLGGGYYFGEIYKTKEQKNFGLNPNTGLPIPPGSPLIDVSDTPFIFLNEDERENHYLFMQDVWHLADDWELTAGVRFDHYSDFGDTINPRLALVWSARHNLTIKTLYGEAFRAPSFAETREQANPALLGNPALEPETLKSYELAFNYKPTYKLTLDLNLFHYAWKDIIQFIPDSSGNSRTAQNSGEQRGHGLEFEFKWEINPQLSLSANYSWQKSKDERNDFDAANAPEQQIYIRADSSLPGDWTLSAQVSGIMDRNRAFNDTRQPVDDYTTTDLVVRKSFFVDRIEFSLVAKNIFNEQAYEPAPNAQPQALIPNDLPLPDRRVFGEIRYRFY